jgi:hypothetical protein
VALAEAFAALLAVAGQRILDDRQGVRGRLDFVDFHGFALQLLVIEESCGTEWLGSRSKFATPE